MFTMFSTILKLPWKEYMLVSFKKSCSTASIDNVNNTQLLSDLLGIPQSETSLYVKKFKLFNKDADILKETVQYCQSLGFNNKDILKTRGLLTVSSLVLEHHYRSMEEGGFNLNQPRTLARSIHYMRRKVNFLKTKNLIKRSINVEKIFLSYIKDPKFVETFRGQVYIDNPDSLPWINIHSQILTALLKYKLNATDEDLIKLFRIHKNIQYKSFRTILENISIAEDLGFTSERILKYGYILNNYPKYTKTVLSEIPVIAGCDMRKAMYMFPKLILTSPKNIRKIYTILKSYNIPDETIRRKMNIFHMSPHTVQMRLEEISSSPDLKSLFQHSNLLFLIVHLNRANKRLSFLQQLRLKCASLTVLGTDYSDKFENYVREGKDVITRVDLKSLLKSIFPGEKIDMVLKKIARHPFHLHVPLKDMDNTYKFLINCNFRTNDIQRVPWIILYPEEKITKALNQVKYDPTMEYQSLSGISKLNLILYVIEKEHHFTGNGIWRNDENSAPEKTLE